MKRRLIIKALEKAGYTRDRGDGDHDVYEKKGRPPIQVPKHREINNNTARTILDVAGAKRKLKK
jgi:mRNA interferase HicA